MEYPQSQGWGDSTEECHSSESGWTTYIDSPVRHHDGVVTDDDDGDGDGGGGGGGDGDGDAENGKEQTDDDGHVHGHEGYYDHGYGGYVAKQDSGDDDDSMASDASSGPTTNPEHEAYGSHGHASGACAPFERAAHKTVEGGGRRDRRKGGGEKEKSKPSRDHVAPFVQTGGGGASKVRTHSWLGRRK